MLRIFFADHSTRYGLQAVHELTGHDVRVHVEQQMHMIGFAAELNQFDFAVRALLPANRLKPIQYLVGKAFAAIFRD